MTESTDRLQNQRPEIRVRISRSEDREFVHELAIDVFSIYGSYGRYLTQWFDSESVDTWIAETEQEQVGLTMIGITRHPTLAGKAVADLLAIAVKPSYQTKGVGTILLQSAIDIAPGMPSSFPIIEMHLSVAETNARAQRLFSRRGFRMIAGEGVYPTGQRALHMVKKL